MNYVLTGIGCGLIGACLIPFLGRHSGLAIPIALGLYLIFSSILDCVDKKQ